MWDALNIKILEKFTCLLEELEVCYEKLLFSKVGLKL